MYIELELNKIIQVFCFLLLIGCSFTKNDIAVYDKTPKSRIIDQYKTDYIAFESHLDQLNSVAMVKKPSQSLLQDHIKSTRLAFKKIEFIFDYKDPEYSYLNVNGGPLPKLNNEISEVDIIPPNGLQRLDELIFADDYNVTEIRERVEDLINSISFIKESHLSGHISDQNIFESLRSGIIRLYTLGLTGFDTPGSGNSIQESLVSLRSMKQAFSNYENHQNRREKKGFDEVIVAYEKGILALNSGIDFNDFDRMSFLKVVVNPIYKSLYTFQKLIRVETSSLHVHAQDYQVDNLFDEDFLNKDYYTQYFYSDIKNEDAIKLGEILFYDPILSKNMDMSCSSCHNPSLGFADGLAKSPTNKNNIFTKRNSPSLIDVVYSSKYFWDMREHDLEKQVAHVVEDSLEFNFNFKKIEKRLIQSEEYKVLFENAYGDISKNDVNRRSISNAIASYVNTLTSFNSPFDKFVRGESEIYDDSAIAGFNLFMGKAACGTCHFAPVFNGSVPPFYTDSESEVLGVTLGYDPENPIIDEDMGRSYNGRKGDAHPHFDHSIKTVTVRNVSLTGPYMHNGLFETLEDVVNFYNDGGGVGMGLDIENQTLASDPLNLSELEKSQLVDFMTSLTDTTGLSPGIINLPKFENQPYWNQRGLPKVMD